MNAEVNVCISPTVGGRAGQRCAILSNQRVNGVGKAQQVTGDALSPQGWAPPASLRMHHVPALNSSCSHHPNAQSHWLCSSESCKGGGRGIWLPLQMELPQELGMPLAGTGLGSSRAGSQGCQSHDKNMMYFSLQNLISSSCKERSCRKTVLESL